MDKVSPIISLLTRPAATWGSKAKPIVIVDDVVFSASEIEQPITGSRAYIVGIKDKELARLCEFLDVESAFFYEMRASDIGPLARLKRLKHLAIKWNTKLVELTVLKDIAPLETLVLEHVSKVNDLSPLESQPQLKALQIAGNLGSLSPKAKVDTLAPIGSLPNLLELRLLNLKVKIDGLRPIANCKKLKELRVANTFDTEDYAFLAANLPSTQCTHFSAFVRSNRKDADGNSLNRVMIVGKGKPFLDSSNDQNRIDAYVEKFNALRVKHMSNDH